MLFLGQYTGGWTTTHLFSVYRSSLKDPLFYIRLFGHVLGHGSWDHFLNNMLLLLVVGPPMEEKYGSLPLLKGILLIVVIQGAIWINFSFPYFMGTNLYFMGYLIVSSIQMGANIDYAIVIATRFNELKDKMEHKQAMIETINFAFPTILTSGTIMTVSGLLIGRMTSDACIVGIGQCLGRGTIISILLVLFVLPQILLIGTRIVDRTSFAVPKLVARSSGNGRMRVNGIVQGEIHGSVAGTMNAIVDGDVQLTVISGNVSQELDDNEKQEVQNEDQ